jgi:hypothetical protein
MKRILIIGAKTTADVATAANLVRTYINDGFSERIPFGRHHGVIYGPAGGSFEFAAYVWHTQTQITVHFGDK